MASNRFILRYRGEGSIPSQDLEKIQALPDTKILDSTSRMLLVEGPFDTKNKELDLPSQWILIPEENVSLPDPKPKIIHDFEGKNK